MHNTEGYFIINSDKSGNVKNVKKKKHLGTAIKSVLWQYSGFMGYIMENMWHIVHYLDVTCLFTNKITKYLDLRMIWLI